MQSYEDGAYDDVLSYDELGYGADLVDPEYGVYGDDSSHYYGDEYNEYYEQYGKFVDAYGDDDSFDYEERKVADCIEDSAGVANITGAIPSSYFVACVFTWLYFTYSTRVFRSCLQRTDKWCGRGRR